MTLRTADKLVCSLEIGTNQLVTEIRQFDAAVADPGARREVASLLRDTCNSISEVIERLDPDSRRNTIYLPGAWDVA